MATTLPSTEDGLVYYYCSDEAFRAIVRRGTLRMSNIFHLNDGAEFLWAIQQLCAHGDALSREYEGVNPESIEAAYRIESKGETDVSVVCFSQDDDDLSQWRGYGDDARGVAIGFNADYLLNECAMSFSMVPAFRGNVLAGEVLYVDDDGNIVAPNSMVGTSLLDFFRTSYDNHALAAVPRDHEAPFRSFVDNLLATGGLVKHDAFRHENEWRIIYHCFDAGTGGHPDAPDDERGLCTLSRRDGRHTPYYVLPFDPASAIASLRLGPKHAEKGRHIALREFLRKEGLRDQVLQGIRDSRIPYR